MNLGATSVDSLSVAGFNLTDVGFDDTSHSIYIVESGGDADKVLTIHGQNGAQGGGDSNGNDLQLYAGLGFGAGSNGSVILGQATDKVAIFGATPQAQSAPIADAAGGAIIDAEARTALNALLAYFRLLGPIHP